MDGVDLEVRPGEVVALMGPSGCGKTTTLRIAAGLEVPDGGKVEIEGRDVTAVPPERRGVGMVFQDYALFPHMNVAANVAFGLRRLPRPERGGRVQEVLRLVGLEDLASRMPAELSGGQQQRVALARALAPSPAVILLDEPLSNLDPPLRRSVRHEMLSVIRSSGAAALWVTHDHDEGLVVADRVAIMRDGAIRQTGSPAEIWHAPGDAWIARFVGCGDLVSGTVRDGYATTALGRVRAPGLSEGQPIAVLVRPGDVVIDHAGSPGTVVRRHFTGRESVYCVELPDGTLLHCRQPAGVEIPRGAGVTVQLVSEDLPVFR